MRKRFVIGTVAALMYGALPAHGAAITDQAGDANGINGVWYSPAMLGYITEVVRDFTFQGDPAGEGVATPASHGPADLREVTLQTEYEGVAVGGNGIDYRATALLVRIRTEEPAKALSGTGTMELELGFQARPPGPPPNWDDDDPTTFGESECRMSFWVTMDESGSASSPNWYRFEDCGDRATSVTSSAWSATTSGSTVTLRFPLGTFESVGGHYLREGGTIVRPTAVSSVRYTAIDVTRAGAEFVIGSDVPRDVACTQDCPAG